MLSAFINANIEIQNDVHSIKDESLTCGIGKALKGKPLILGVAFEVAAWKGVLQVGLFGFWEGGTVRKTGAFNSSHG